MTTTRERALEAALRDAKALLDHYTSGRPDNWDGSTKGQALATIREARAALALPPSPPAIDEELLGHAKTALAEHAKLYAINADMLAALQAAMNVMRSDPHAREARAIAAAAIARATGREG